MITSSDQPISETRTTTSPRSELLGTRHALTGQVVVLPQEEMEAFNAFVREMVQSFTPETVAERQLAQSYAHFQWRINRAAAIEDHIFTLGLIEEVAANLNLEHPQIHNAVSNAKTFRSQSSEITRLGMHSQRLVNQAEKVLQQLLHLQASRRQRQQSQLGDAARIYKLHRMQDLPFDPQALGFDLTLPQIQDHIRRGALRDHSLDAESLDWNNAAYLKKYGEAVA